MLTDHTRRESVLKYEAVQAEAMRKLMRKVIPIGDRGCRQIAIDIIIKMAECMGIECMRCFVTS